MFCVLYACTACCLAVLDVFLSRQGQGQGQRQGLGRLVKRYPERHG